MSATQQFAYNEWLKQLAGLGHLPGSRRSV